MAARTLLDHVANVFTGVLVRGNENIDIRRDRLALLRTKLTEEHLPDDLTKTLFKIICLYDDQTGDVIDQQGLEDLLEGATDRGTSALLIEQFKSYASKTVDNDVYKFSLEQIREKKAAKETAEALRTAAEILQSGVEVKRDEVLVGQKDARAYILGELARIDNEMSFQESPEGNMRVETSDMWREYEKQRELNDSGGFQGILTGIDFLDEALGGIKDGDLALFIGYSASGKTSLCVQTSWYASVMQGKNVIYITTETLRPQVRRKIISRHSCLPMFGLEGGSSPQGRLMPGGLNARDIRLAKLTESELMVYRAVLDDMANNPEYGDIDVVQMPNGGTIDDAFLRATRLGKEKRIDFVVMDYIALFHSRNKRSDKRVALGDNLRDAKEFATTFQNGTGVPVVSPWQVNRDARDKAATTNSYSLQSLAETADAANTPDTVVSILDDQNRPKERIFELSISLLKQRDGELIEPAQVDVDYATSRFGSLKTSGLFQAMAGLSTLGAGPS